MSKLISQIDLQILNLAYNKSEIAQKVHTVIDKFAERGLRSLGVAYQVRKVLGCPFTVQLKLARQELCGGHSFLPCRTCQTEGKRAQVARGILLLSCHSLIHRGTTAQKQFKGHLTLV